MPSSGPRSAGIDPGAPWQATANLIPESVEWFNTLLGVFWGLINPEMFASVADTLEDVMQASVPSVIGKCSVDSPDRPDERRKRRLMTSIRERPCGRY